METIAVWSGMLGLDFHVTEPAELVCHLHTLATRYAAATSSRSAAASAHLGESAHG